MGEIVLMTECQKLLRAVLGPVVTDKCGRNAVMRENGFRALMTLIDVLVRVWTLTYLENSPQ